MVGPDVWGKTANRARFFRHLGFCCNLPNQLLRRATLRQAKQTPRRAVESTRSVGAVGMFMLQINNMEFGRGPDFASVVLLAERHVSLLSRCRPLNWEEERKRLWSLWSMGREGAPAFRYAATPDLARVRAAMEQLDAALPPGPEGALYRARIAELELEARLVEAVGSAHFGSLARRRYRTEPEQDAADELCHRWLTSASHDLTEDSDSVLSDDTSDPRSLLCRMQAWVGRRRIPFRVQVSGELVSLAATGEDVIFVTRSRWMPCTDVERVVVHEVLGHAEPRVRARSESDALFRAGTAGGNDAQEGFAVFCEQKYGVLHPRRRAELALRHQAATHVWAGAEFQETMRGLLATGAHLDVVLPVALRAYRGGGLAREGAYLPAFCAVSRAIDSDPSVVDWLGAGRLGLPAIAVLRRGGYVLHEQNRNQ